MMRLICFLFTCLLFAKAMVFCQDTLPKKPPVTPKPPITSPFQGRSYLNNSESIATRITILQKEIDDQLRRRDTAAAINNLLLLSDLHANNAQYGAAYDGYWRALLLAEQSGDVAAKALTYHGLGWLYTLYKREEKAMEYFNLSLAIKKELVKSQQIGSQQLVQDYYALATLYRKEKNISKARRYLDSCRIFRERGPGNPSQSPYFSAEDGYLFLMEGKYNAALEKLNQSRQFFEGLGEHAYLGILYQFYGDYYKAINKYDSSILFYKNGLRVIDNTKMHVDIEPEILENLADVYALKGDHRMAYQALQQAKQVTEQQFGSRSAKNKELLEIKDDYRIAKEKQQLEQLENERKISNLKATIFAVSLVFVFILGIVLFRHLRSRHRAEKALMQKKQELEITKSKEILEIKNKELTASTLRIIEKDELLADLKDKLNDQRRNPDAAEINKLMKSIDANNYNNWEEFEARFSSVNESFYYALAEQFPQLTHTDKKVCALIKLDFTSKDMSRLLGISIESVHTTRYRLRKKLNLNRDMNLTDFIQGIG